MSDLAAPVSKPPGPMPFLLLLDEAQWWARRHFRATYFAVAIPVALFSAAIAALQAFWFSRQAEGSGPEVGMLYFLSPRYLLVFLVQISVLVIANNALQAAATAAVSGRPIDMREAWRFSVRWRVAGTLLLVTVLCVVSVLCCCLPAFVVFPLLGLVPVVMAEEGSTGPRALARGSRLALYRPLGRWQEMPLLRMLALLFASALLTYTVGTLVSLPFQIPIYVDAFRKAAIGEDVIRKMSSWVWLQVPAQLLYALASEAVYLYACFGTALLFHDARGRKEAADLRMEIEALFPPPSSLTAGEPRP